MKERGKKREKKTKRKLRVKETGRHGKRGSFVASEDWGYHMTPTRELAFWLCL